ncbi:MAG: multidrug effflux MFS transporter [Deltaproteobacteria bacterium]|nr:multidrug effflux MFS transporter [Deltaproteobacteria bacterium]
MEKKKQPVILAILGTLIGITPFSIDMYLPGFPAIASDLHTDISQVTLSLTSFFIGVAVGQLFFGPISDRYGRKTPLLVGLALYVIASLGCVFVRSVNALIALRVFEAVGGCAGMVISRAIVRDMYSGPDIARVFSLLMLVMGVAPILAPTIGGIVTTTLGWWYIFLVLMLIGLSLLIISARVLPETRQADPSISLHPLRVLREYLTVLREPRFATYALTGSIASAGLFAYISGSPFVFMKLFSISEKHYGWIFGMNALGLITASQINRVLLRKRTSAEIILRASSLQFTFGLLLALSTRMHLIGFVGTVLLIFGFMMMQGFVFPNASALAIEPFTRNAGSAAALLGGLQMTSGAVASALVSYLHNNTALPMAGVMAICGVISFSTLLTGRAVLRRKVAATELNLSPS